MRFRKLLNKFSSKTKRIVGEKMGKYQLDSKGQAAVAKYHEKNKPAQFDKKQQVEKIRAEYLNKKQKQTDK